MKGNAVEGKAVLTCCIIHTSSHSLALCCTFQYSQVVSQPLDARASHCNAALEGVLYICLPEYLKITYSSIASRMLFQHLDW